MAIDFGELIVGDALVKKTRVSLNAEVGDQHVVLLGCSLVFVNVRGNAALNFEKVVRIAVYLVGGRGGETDDERVEVLKDGPILFENRTVCLVDNDQVKVRGRIHAQAVVIANGVNGIEDGRIR